jgi:hypothetical protein
MIFEHPDGKVILNKNDHASLSAHRDERDEGCESGNVELCRRVLYFTLGDRRHVCARGLMKALEGELPLWHSATCWCSK